MAIILKLSATMRSGWMMTGVLAFVNVLPDVSMAADGDHPGDLSQTVREQIERADIVWLCDATQRQLRGCRIQGKSGVWRHTPDGVGNYRAFWTRDFAYMIESAGDLLDPKEIKTSIFYLLAGQRDDGCMPDRVNVAGKNVAGKGVFSSGPEQNPLADHALDNGEFWATPVAWVAPTIARRDPDLAVKMVQDVIADFRERRITECVNGDYHNVPEYVVSATNVYGLVRERPAGNGKFIQQFTVARNDKLHESWPDLAVAANGDFVLTYQESDGHGAGPVSTIVTRVSQDRGQTWGKRTVVVQLSNRRRDGWLNCSRIVRLQDESLLIAVDCIPQNPPPNVHHWWTDNRAVVWLFRSRDNGRSWVGPEKTSVRGGIVPSITQLRDGTLLIGITSFEENNNWRQFQVVYRSTDNGKTWKGPIVVGRHPKRQPNEGDFVELATGEVVCYMRDDEPGVTNGLKAISRDGGRTWSPLYGSGPWRYAGRPDVGLLSTGEVFLTTRVGAPQAGHYLGAYMEPQDVALQPTPLKGPASKEARWVLIDNDTNPKRPDWGYSGWVELPDGSIDVVQYITADAPAGKPFIRGYRVPRSSIDQGRH